MNIQTTVVERLRNELTRLKSLPASEAVSMPPEYYTSEAFLALEKDYVFRKDWVCLGHEGEVAKPGDFYTTEIVDEQLLVTRTQEGEVKVYSNVCRHRGNLVAEGRGNAGRFTCKYHGWTYTGKDGQLIGAPLMDQVPGFDKKQCSLPSFKTEIWNGFLFVNLSGDAPPLAPQLAEMAPLIRNYHIDERNFLYTTDDVWQTNWKSLCENFMEGYHLSATHAKTLHPITPTALCEKIPGNDAFTGYKAHYNPSTPERGPFHADLTKEEQRFSGLYCIYPNLVFSVAPHFTLFLCLRPAGADAVALRWGVAGVLTNPEDPGVHSYLKLCNEFNAEDRAKLETMQRAMKTRYFSGGRLAGDHYEGTIWDIYQYMARKLGSDVDLQD